MLRNRAFALASVLALGFSAAACGDDEGETKPVDTVDCAVTPDHEECAEPGEAREGNVYSYLSGLSLPADKDDCCTDLNGEEGFDNALIGILGLVKSFAADLDIQEVLNGVFDDGSLTLIFESVKPPADIAKRGTFDMNIYLGDSASSQEDRFAGNGEFTLDGAPVTTVKATIARRLLTASVDRLPLKLDIGGLLGDLDLPIGPQITLNVDAAQLRLHISEGDTGFSTNDMTHDQQGKPTNYLTGGINIALVQDIVNALAGECHDSLQGEGNGLLEVTETPGDETAAVSCTKDVSTLELNDGTICEYLGMVCSVGSAIGGLLDVDTNDNGVYDGLSLGVRLKLAGATIAQ